MEHSTNTTTSTEQAAESGMLGKATIAAGALYASFAGLQLALAAGAPIGEHFWGGGQPSVLPASYRIAGGVAALVLVAMGTTVVDRAGLWRKIGPLKDSWLRPATWLVAGYLVLNALGNFTSSSSVESGVFGPATVAMALLTGFVAARGRRG